MSSSCLLLLEMVGDGFQIKLDLFRFCANFSLKNYFRHKRLERIDQDHFQTVHLKLKRRDQIL